MSVVTIKAPEMSSAAVAGDGMDRAIERRRLPRNAKIAIGAGAALLLALLAWWFAPSGASQTVDASRLTISEVRNGTFEDFLPLRGRVTPLVTVYLDAVEGGRIERVLVEDGTTVAKGQLLAILSNAELQLSVLARQTEVIQQLNSMRSQELELERSRTTNQNAVIEADYQARRVQRQYEREAPLAARGFVAGRQFRDTEAEATFQREKLAVLRRAQTTDERLQASQLAQLRSSAQALQASLAIANANLDSLNLRAPVAGQLSGFSIQVGQSMRQGERLGQIDSPGRNKLVAGVDEFYLGRVRAGQTATAEIGGRSYAMRVSKIYPQVRGGQFEVDLVFVGDAPRGVQLGQTLATKLTLSDPAPARLIPNGAFYNDTGGAWLFVVAPDGGSAERRQVRLGRRNADFVEVLDGLDRGERVITSPYTGLLDKQRLSISTER